MKSINRILILPLLLLQLAGSAQQKVKEGFEIHELERISDAFFNPQDLSFNLVYTYSDSTQPSTVLETITSNWKVKEGKFYAFLDSMISMQGSRYQLTVDLRDSLIVVSNRTQQTKVTQLPVLDTMFLQAHVDSLSILHHNDSTEVLHVYFNNSAPYSKYKLTFDPNTYLIKKIEYYLRAVPIEAGVSTSGTNIVTIDVTAYSTAFVGEDVFREDQFVYEAGGQFYAKPTYSNFQIVNNTANK